MFKAILALCLVQLLRAQSNPIVNTKYGPVEGESVPIHTGQIIDSYLAIPFAKPPLDQLRFAVRI